MKLSSTQIDALNKSPLFLCQRETDLNIMIWVDNYATRDFRQSTIDSLIAKDLLEFKKELNGQEDRTNVILTEKAIELGYKSNLKQK